MLMTTCGGTEPFLSYLDRWYMAIVSLTALTTNMPPATDRPAMLAGNSSAIIPDYLDDYWGFTIHLAEIFRRIGTAAWQSRQNNGNVYSTEEEEDDSNIININNNNDDDDIEEEASILESAVQQLMYRDASTAPVFYPGVVEGLTPECIQEFVLCNRAYQYSALVQIYRRLRKSPSTCVEVQTYVKEILQCVCEIRPSGGLSPWVMLTTPLFIAGCEAHGEDRERVRELLETLHDTIRVPNVLQALNFLEVYWMNGRQEEGEDWCSFLGEYMIYSMVNSD